MKALKKLLLILKDNIFGLKFVKFRQRIFKNIIIKDSVKIVYHSKESKEKKHSVKVEYPLFQQI